jgi:hypothetical protein
VDICLATRPLNGGLINLQELCQFLRQRRKSDRGVVSEDDCLRAISKLKVLCFTMPLNQILNITFYGRGSMYDHSDLHVFRNSMCVSSY